MNPCITCTKQGGAEQKMMPIKDEQGAAFFERPHFERKKRTHLTAVGSSGTFRACCGSMQGRLERPPSGVLLLHLAARGARGTYNLNYSNAKSCYKMLNRTSSMAKCLQWCYNSGRRYMYLLIGWTTCDISCN